MTREQAIKIIRRYECNSEHHEACEMAINALEQESCEDCVSREAVLDLCDSKDEEYKVRHFREDVECLPPVQPKQRTGRWEYIQYDGNPNIGNWHCSECNRIVCGAITAVNPVYSYKYCPECGAKMREVEE